MTTINFKWTSNEDYNVPNNNYSEETQTLEFGESYDFSDYLTDNGVNFEFDEESNKYYVLDECDERTGEVYWVI